jgi:hypothetical protein
MTGASMEIDPRLVERAEKSWREVAMRLDRFKKLRDADISGLSFAAAAEHVARVEDEENYLREGYRLRATYPPIYYWQTVVLSAVTELFGEREDRIGRPVVFSLEDAKYLEALRLEIDRDFGGTA